MDVQHYLMEAHRNGEIVSIIYHGGSQPGTKRQIFPLKVTCREVRARDIASGVAKLYLIPRIEIPADTNVANDYNPEFAALFSNACPKFDSILELKNKLPDLQSWGWHVELSDDVLSVHHRFKNGKPKKLPVVSVVKTDRVNRPWRVDGPDLAYSRSYANLFKALQLFIQQAEEYAPHKQQ